jgi:soluble lytic murein transglycosylase
MLREDWPQVVSWIAALPQDERQDESWTYWLARALQGTGDTQAADALYRKTAHERTYYGFLAADRIGSEYHLDHIETPVSAALINEIAGLDAVKRVKELFALGRWGQAHSEWRAATAGMDNTRLQAAAKLAEQEGWHDRAIFTLAQTGYWDDLVLRFPLQHATLVEENAKRHGIDIAWVFAVMRQESAFMSNARSHAGAMGLMQLMPATARSVAKTMLNRKPPRRGELLEPDINIALGSAYLKQMKGELGDSAVLATAAYNAGPHRVTRWLPERTLPADIWIELVPFDETRGYLRRVLAYTVIYEKRMGKTPTRLNERLHPVPPSISLLSGTQRDAPVISAS